MRDDEIEALGERYCRLNSRYGLHDRGVTFALFLTAPDANEQWIQVYFANPALLGRRRDGANVTLKAFLENGPKLVLLGAQAMDEQQRIALGDAADLPLPRQQIAAEVLHYMDVQALQEESDDRFERTHTVEMRGGRYVEAFHDHYPPCKYKTSGWKLKGALAHG